MKKLSKICFAFLALSLLSSGHAFGSIDFGICGSAVEIREANWPYIDQLFSHMTETNIKSIRVSFPMAYGAENQSNEYLIKVAKYNAFLDKCDSNGIDVLLLLAYGSEFFYKNWTSPGSLDTS